MQRIRCGNLVLIMAVTRMGMIEEADAEAEMSQERSEEPPVRRRRRRRGPRSRDKANGEGKTSPPTSTGRKRGRPAKVKKREEDEEEEEEEGKSKESEQGESIGEEDKEIMNATEETLPSLRSKARSRELATPTPTKEWTNTCQPSPADSSRAESPSEPPEYFECPEQECPRKYKHMKSLKHHLACAHQGIRRHSLKRKNATMTELHTDNEDRKSSEIMQSPAAKKTKADLLIANFHKGKASVKRSSLVEYGSGDSEKEENEAHEEEKNEACDEVKQVRRTRRRKAARKFQKPRDQSDEDEKDEDKEFGTSETSTPEKKETTRPQLYGTEESHKKDDMGPSATGTQQPRMSHTLGFGNNFTFVNSPSVRGMMSGSPVKGSLSAALKISNNQIHGSNSASGSTSESQLGQAIHQSSLTPALERMTVGQRDASDTASRAHVPTERPQASLAEGDTGETVGLHQRSEGQFSPPVEDRSPLKAKRKTRVSGVDKVPDKSRAKVESTSTSSSGAELLMRLSGAAAFNCMTDSRLKAELSSSGLYPPSSIPCGYNMDGLLQRNGAVLFGGRQTTGSSSKDTQLGMPSSGSAPPSDQQLSLGMGAFPHGALPFFTAEAFSGYPNIAGYPLGTRDLPYPMGLGGIPAFGMVADMNSAAFLAELNKARGAST